VANHYVTGPPQVCNPQLNADSQKCWVWLAWDCTAGRMVDTRFALKLATVNLALHFHSCFMDAKQENSMLPVFNQSPYWAEPNRQIPQARTGNLTLDDGYRHLIKAILAAECPLDLGANRRLIRLHPASELYKLLCCRFDIPVLAEDNIVGLWETAIAKHMATTVQDANKQQKSQGQAPACTPTENALRLAGYYRQMARDILNTHCPNDPQARDRQLSGICASELYQILCDKYDISQLSDNDIINKFEDSKTGQNNGS
jgi:hypothetical protein